MGQPSRVEFSESLGDGTTQMVRLGIITTHGESRWEHIGRGRGGEKDGGKRGVWLEGRRVETKQWPEYARVLL